MGFFSFLFGRKGRSHQVPMLSPEQRRLQGEMASAISYATNRLKQLKDFDFTPIEQRAKTQFTEETVPGLAERFTGMGGQRGSGFLGALGAAGSGLQESLAELRSNVGLQSQAQERQSLQGILGSLSGPALHPQFSTLYEPPTRGLIGGVLPNMVGNLSSYITGKITGAPSVGYAYPQAPYGAPQLAPKKTSSRLGGGVEGITSNQLQQVLRMLQGGM